MSFSTCFHPRLLVGMSIPISTAASEWFQYAVASSLGSGKLTVDHHASASKPVLLDGCPLDVLGASPSSSSLCSAGSRGLFRQCRTEMETVRWGPHTRGFPVDPQCVEWSRVPSSPHRWWHVLVALLVQWLFHTTFQQLPTTYYPHSTPSSQLAIRFPFGFCDQHPGWPQKTSGFGSRHALW